MRNDNYPSASEVVRNLSQIKVSWEVLHTEGKFRLIRFAPPYFGGNEIWVVNEKGFMWEPVKDLDAGLAYLSSDEAQKYNSEA